MNYGEICALLAAFTFGVTVGWAAGVSYSNFVLKKRMDEFERMLGR